VKIPKEQNLDHVALEAFKKEVSLMNLNTHPNVVRLLGACTIPGKLQIVTERCCGDVDALLYDKSYKGSLFDRLKMARDTASGMRWLHSSTNTIHGDLKPANLLVDENARVKITDFGFSQLKKDVVDEATVKGSVMWMAPEKLTKQKPVTEKIDVFSFGIILWEIIQRRKPYVFENYANVRQFCQAVCYRDERPPLTEDIPVDLRNLMSDCWKCDPDERCSFSNIVTRLNLILVDCVVTTPSAASFWKNKVMGSNPVDFLEHVEWSTFLALLTQEIGRVEDSTMSELKYLLVETMNVAGIDHEYVKIARFDQAEKWFGAFYLPGEGPTVIRQFSDLTKKEWFHGYITQKTADALLAPSVHPGSFLIRLSSTNPSYPFTLSRPIGHVKLERAATGISAQDRLYPSLEAFVAGNTDTLVYSPPKIPRNIASNYMPNF